MTTNPRDLFRPQREELPQQCASCPFRPGGDFHKIVKKLCDAEGVKFSKGQVVSARIKIMSEAETRGDFMCHGTVYHPDLSMRPQHDWRQCPGATTWFKKHGERTR